MVIAVDGKTPPEVDRRRALTSGLTAINLTMPVPSYAQALKQRHPDAALLLLAEQLKASQAESDRLMVVSRIRKTPEANEAWEVSFAKCHQAVDTIEDVHAHTLHGLRVKALAAQWCHGEKPFQVGSDTTDARLASQIVRALLIN